MQEKQHGENKHLRKCKITTDNHGCLRATDPDMTYGSRPGQDITMASVASRTPTSAISSPPLTLQICLSPQHMNLSPSLSLPYPHPVLACQNSAHGKVSYAELELSSMCIGLCHMVPWVRQICLLPSLAPATDCRQESWPQDQKRGRANYSPHGWSSGDIGNCTSPGQHNRPDPVDGVQVSWP